MSAGADLSLAPVIREVLLENPALRNDFVKRLPSQHARFYVKQNGGAAACLSICHFATARTRKCVGRLKLWLSSLLKRSIQFDASAILLWCSHPHVLVQSVTHLQFQ